MTVAECQQRMSSKEFLEWQVYALFEPFGPRTDWERTAILAAQQQNLASRKRVVTVEDFMPAEPVLIVDEDIVTITAEDEGKQKNLQTTINNMFKHAFGGKKGG